MDFFTAQRLPTNTGFTWTIASRLSDALACAEQQFGERDPSYFLAGVEFGPDNHPRVWYPGNRKHIVIQLSAAARDDFAQAVYQLSHEIVHLLAPTGGNHANVLEEGLATHFSEIYTRESTGRLIIPSVESYMVARDLVRQLLAIEPAAIRKLRTREPRISAISSDLIRSEIPGAATSLADQLGARFTR